MNASCLLMAYSLLAVQAEPAESPLPAGQEASAPILIDWVHANDFSMIGLRPGIYDYHVICGLRHGMDFLASLGAWHEYLSEGTITPQRLAPHKLLFINLVSAEREPFLVSEILAIKDFVSGGGSLLVVMDHSNCYFHSHRLKPLLAELGIQAFVDTVCDVPPRTLGAGNGWLTITKFSPHPITEGLRRLGYQTGGRLDPRYSVAWTDKDAWADEWSISIYGQNSDGGNYGNFKRDDFEPFGPHGVVLAREFGKGRIVIVGDQNMWGDAFINYGDNYRLWVNAMGWLLRDRRLVDWKAYENWHRPRIVLYEPGDAPRFGSCADDDYYNLFCLLGRHYWTFANDRLDEPADLRVVADGRREFSAEEISKLSACARDGGKLLVLPHVAQEREADDGHRAKAGPELPPGDQQPAPAGRQPRQETPQASKPESPGAAAGGKEQPLLSAALDLSGAEQKSTESGTLYVFSGGGRIMLLADELAPPCNRIAPPTRIPNAEEGNRETAVLKAVRQVLGE